MDANGNLLTKDGVTYRYNSANRLTSVVSGTVVATFEYNPDGLRTTMIVNGVRTSYLWDINASLPVILTDTNSIYIYGLSLIARQSGDAVEYYHSDALGSVRNLTNGSGQNIGAYSYKPFGEGLITSGTSANTFQYTGQLSDSYIKLYYLRARYYQPETGRWISPDSIVPDRKNPQSLNRFSYAFNNPLRFTDPTGYDPLDQQWIDEFERTYNREPEWYDYSIQLFSLAFPDEWNQNSWNTFYTPDGKIRDEGAGLTKVYHQPTQARNWGNMDRALTNLASYYLPGEEGEFVRDVGLLFGGLYGRKEKASSAEAAWGGGQHTALYLFADETLGCDWAGIYPTDVGANAPHWAWSFVLGYAAGPNGGFFGNIAHEVQNMWDSRSLDLNMADVYMGTAGSTMGADLRSRSNGLTLDRIGSALREYIPIQ